MSRVLVINPNASAAVTAAIDTALEPLRLPGGPVFEAVGLPDGPLGIATQLDSDSVVMKLAALVTRDAADGFVIACFSDPGLHSVREAALGRPVMGIGEWGMLRALTLGERFGIIALSAASVGRQIRAVRQTGLDARYAGSRAVGASAAETAADGVRERLIEAALALVLEDGADVVILGCAGMAAHRGAVEAAVGRPVVEPTQQAAVAAMGAVLLARNGAGAHLGCAFSTD